MYDSGSVMVTMEQCRSTVGVPRMLIPVTGKQPWPVDALLVNALTGLEAAAQGQHPGLKFGNPDDYVLVAKDGHVVEGFVEVPIDKSIEYELRLKATYA